jgi:hypothetical protein
MTSRVFFSRYGNFLFKNFLKALCCIRQGFFFLSNMWNFTQKKNTANDTPYLQNQQICTIQSTKLTVLTNSEKTNKRITQLILHILHHHNCTPSPKLYTSCSYHQPLHWMMKNKKMIDNPLMKHIANHFNPKSTSYRYWKFLNDFHLAFICSTSWLHPSSNWQTCASYIVHKGFPMDGALVGAGSYHPSFSFWFFIIHYWWAFENG